MARFNWPVWGDTPGGVGPILRENRPDLTVVPIHLEEETSDEALARALEQNEYVTAIIIYLEGNHFQIPAWPALCRALANRSILVRVQLCDMGALSTDGLEATRVFNQQFVRAFAQNSNILSVEFESLNMLGGILIFGEDLSYLIDTATSVKCLPLICLLDPDGLTAVADSLQRNTNIETLELALPDNFSARIIQALASNRTLKNLEWNPGRTDERPLELLHAIQHLLDSSSTIEHFHFKGGHGRAHLFAQVLSALTDSASVQDVSFSSSKISGPAREVAFCNMLTRKTNLRSLAITDFSEFVDCTDACVGAIISCMTRPHTSLRKLELDFGIFGNFVQPPIAFVRLLHAISRSKLEHLRIRVVHARQDFELLLSALPNFKLKELELVIIYNGPNMKQDLLEALKNNYSLRSVKGGTANFTFNTDDEIEELFNDDDKRRLAFFAERNARLDAWTENPSLVPRDLWPYALDLAVKAGRESLFCSLRSALGFDALQAKQGKRTRKRPL